MDDTTKTNSTKAATKEAKPPTSTIHLVFNHQGISGMAFSVNAGSGNSSTVDLNPSIDPRNTRGTWIPNQSASSERRVPIEMAACDFSAHSAMVHNRRQPKKIDGRSKAL